MDRRIYFPFLNIVLLFIFIIPGYGKIINVCDFGAKGDGVTDNTPYFQQALDSLKEKGGIVFVPSGHYLVNGTLTVPPGVTLEGTFRNAPPRSLAGSVLLAVFGKGKPDEKPFIMLNTNSTICGLVIHYPEQIAANPPLPYPWTIRGHGDNCSIKNCLLVNSYQAVDFGTYPCGRHHIDGLYGRPLYRGLYIDKCFDVGRVSNVHFWPFWESQSRELRTFQEKNAAAFIIGRTDWQYMLNCFCLWYAIGYQFITSPEKGTGSGNVMLTNCGSDLGPTAIKVEEVQNHAGISFVNSQFMGAVILENTNHGPVKFTSCGFWGVERANALVYNRNSGRTAFSNCQFYWWDRNTDGYPAILSQNGDLTVMGCEFGDVGKIGIFLSKGIRTAVITGNTFRSKKAIINKAKKRTRSKNNAFSYLPGRIPRFPDKKKLKQKIKEWNR
ncbi:MAG: hypothetical protein GTN53_24520 [Candidatus Aminicenantes bacterium]|nr:hypothetical protein [Candidatus Aminicenantes bacterium]NIN20819.1 hypothetical protein [Candidatus Aminicenantes bacterium]NIO83739.1 hypothetical protein [Candidatus Aminicenantes bacterium]NIQ69659.1 hypothetical protein [Candidatus Aminicenantes bacterium]NIT25673.1 hypothetical protein [Candidatus Aminicenantes bacterium]